jgi:hypothetical protein
MNKLRQRMVNKMKTCDKEILDAKNDGTYIEYYIIRSTEELPQLERKENFLISYRIPSYFQNLPKGPTLEISQRASGYNVVSLDELGELANKVQVLCGLSEYMNPPKYLYILHSIDYKEKFFLKIIGVDFEKDVFRFNPVQKYTILLLEEARYKLWVGNLGFTGLHALEQKKAEEVKRKITEQFNSVSSNLELILNETCIPFEAKELIKEYRKEIRNCLTYKRFNAIESVIWLLIEIYFSVPSNEQHC